MSQLQSLQIEDNQRKEEFLKILSDRYARSILEVIMDKPKAVTEITAETSIPISTVYRRVQSLLDMKMLKISGTISEDGKKFFLYKSKFSAFNASLAGNKIQIQAILNHF